MLYTNIRGVLTVVKETKEFNMAAEDIVKYKSHSYTAEEIISTANKMADKFKKGQQDESYGVSGNNCEGKSNEIATVHVLSCNILNTEILFLVYSLNLQSGL
jgi:hypothetical protein